MRTNMVDTMDYMGDWMDKAHEAELSEMFVDIDSRKVLKAVLMLRRLGNKAKTKEEQIAEQYRWLQEIETYADEFDGWIDWMRGELAKTPEQRQAEADALEDQWVEEDCSAEWQYDRGRDEWDDLWDDRARECGAMMF